jgi:hypothetical protein
MDIKEQRRRSERIQLSRTSHAHDAGIVYEDVKHSTLLLPFRGKLSDRSERSQIKLPHLQL